MDEGRSRSSQEEDKARQASKQLRIAPQGPKNEVTAQTKPQAWLPAPMLHGEPLIDNASPRDFQQGESAYVADALERSLLLPADMAELRNLRRQEVFLSMKSYPSMVRLLTFVTSLAFVPWLPIYIALVLISRPSRPLTNWKRWPTTKAGPWSSSVTSAWMPYGPLKTPRPIS